VTSSEKQAILHRTLSSSEKQATFDTKTRNISEKQGFFHPIGDVRVGLILPKIALWPGISPGALESAPRPIMLEVSAFSSG
jgi:hypothetical protein